jgi:peptide/nickel transport system permease protein
VSMQKYIAKRIVQIVITLIIIMTIMFILFRMMPGDPTAFILDTRMTAEHKAIIRAQFGLDKPIWYQYILYLKNFFRGNFGRSFYYARPVYDLVMQRLPATLLLWTGSYIISYSLGITLGKIIAWRRGGKLEFSSTIFGLFFYCMPIFWVGLIALWIFAYKFGLFPLGGLKGPEVWSNPASTMVDKVWDVIVHITLPLTVLTLAFFAGSMLVMRTSMLETLREDYIMTARAKGLPEKTIRDRHAARNAMLPVVTTFAIAVAGSVGGGVLTETTFSYPGLGKLIVDATLTFDYPLAQASFLFIALLVLVANLVADILYAYLDPRIVY